jgi:hypothetical protein
MGCVVQAKRSNAEIVEQIERNEVRAHVEQRKRKREQEENGGGNTNNSSSSSSTSGGTGAGSGGTDSLEKTKRKFRQQKVLGGQYGESQFRAQSKLLGKVFSANKEK